MSLQELLAQPSIMKVHVSFCGDKYDADLLRIDETGSMTLRTSPTMLHWVSINYARPIGVDKEIIEKFKSDHWDHEYNHLDVKCLKTFDWLFKSLLSGINTELTNDEAELTKVNTTRKRTRQRPVELSLNF